MSGMYGLTALRIPMTTFQLWPHQKEAIPHMAEGHFLLAFAPGLGKTITTIKAMKRIAGPFKPRQHLIICPSPLVTQWINELKDQGLSAYPIRKSVDVQGWSVERSQVDVIITTYRMVQSKPVWLELMKGRYRSLTLDESHNVKNRTAKTTKAIFGANSRSKCLFKRAKQVWQLTGTPILKDPTDLWVFLKKLFPKRLSNIGIETYEDFLHRFCQYIKTPFGIKVIGSKNEDELSALLEGIMMYVTDDNGIRPDLVEDVIRLDAWKIDTRALSDEAKQAMEDLLDELHGENPEGIELDKAEIWLSTLRRLIGEAKAKDCADLIVTELTGGVDKIVVFYQHVSVGQTIEDIINARMGEGTAVRVGGGVPQSERDARKDRFQHDSACRVYLGQMQTAGEGLDGLQVANRVLNLEPAWTPGPNEQAFRRVARGGSPHRHVHASYVVINGSVDDAVLNVNHRRKATIKKVLKEHV